MSHAEPKLYYLPGSCSLSDHVLLEYVKEKTGKKFTIDKVDVKNHTTQSGANYFDINPRGSVPALVFDYHGKKTVLTQNIALLTFIGDNSGIESLSPAKGSLERARLDEALGFCGDLHNAIGGLFHLLVDTEEARKAQTQRAYTRIKQLEDWLQDDRTWWLGDEFTQADAYGAVILSWCKRLGLDLSAYPKCVSLVQKVFSLKAAQEAVKAEGLDIAYYESAN